MNKKIIILALLPFLMECDKNPINNTLIDNNRITAAYNLRVVDSLAETYSEGLQLLSIRSKNVAFDGYSQKWCFIYSSGGIAFNYYFHTTANEVIFDSTSSKNIGSAFISHQWFESNEALRIAEKNGGKDFRMKNPEYTIEASLGEPNVPNSTTFWYITYLSKLDSTKSLMLGIDANTRGVTLKYP